MFGCIRNLLRQSTIWQIRIVALAFLVLCIGGGSQVLVDTFATNTSTAENRLSTMATNASPAVKEATNRDIRPAVTCPVSAPYHPLPYGLELNSVSKALLLLCTIKK